MAGSSPTVSAGDKPILTGRRVAPTHPPELRAAPPEGFDPGSADPAWLWRGTIPCLDGLRAVSILLVLASHLALRPGTVASLLPHDGSLGVEIFFVISGFLITLLLLREHGRTGSLSLKHFYLRRSLRILPAYLFFLLAMWVAEQLSHEVIPRKWWLAALTYTTSFVSRGDWQAGWDLSHMWSLSVEEHFYLLWPCLLLVLGLRRAFLVGSACVVLTPLLRLVLARYLGLSLPSLEFVTVTRMDAIASGCCLAFLATSRTFLRWTRPPGVSLVVVALTAALIFLPAAGFPLFSWSRTLNNLRGYCGDTVRPILIAGLVWGCVRSEQGLLGRLLGCKCFVLLGKISYSIYLWQQFFLSPFRDHWAFQWPVNVLLTLAAASFSYRVIELPFLRLKDRFKS